MQAIKVHVFTDADEATGFGFNYNEWDEKPGTLVPSDAVIVRNGTVQHQPTIDIVCADSQGNKHVVLLTGRLLKAITDVAFAQGAGT